MAEVSAILKRFVNARLRALQAVKRCDQGRLTAASKIKNVAEYFSNKSETVQLRAIRQIESEIFLLLPPEGSRFQNQRERMLELISKSKTINHT